MEVIRQASVALFFSAGLAWTTAGAVPMQFEINGGLDCVEEGGGCEAFMEDTGVTDPTRASVSARFTLNSGQNTTVTGPINEYDDQPGLNYLVNGTASITIGDLVLQFSQYYVRLASYQLDGPGSIFGIWGQSGDHWFFFTMSDRTASHFSQYTLDELAAAPLTNYRLDSFMPASISMWVSDIGRWSAPQGRMPFSIRRVDVPEPGPTAFALVALAFVPLLRRRPTSATR